MKNCRPFPVLITLIAIRGAWSIFVCTLLDASRIHDWVTNTVFHLNQYYFFVPKTESSANIGRTGLCYINAFLVLSWLNSHWKSIYLSFELLYGKRLKKYTLSSSLFYIWNQKRLHLLRGFYCATLKYISGQLRCMTMLLNLLRFPLLPFWSFQTFQRKRKVALNEALEKIKAGKDFLTVLLW